MLKCKIRQSFAQKTLIFQFSVPINLHFCEKTVNFVIATIQKIVLKERSSK